MFDSITRCTMSVADIADRARYALDRLKTQHPAESFNLRYYECPMSKTGNQIIVSNLEQTIYTFIDVMAYYTPDELFQLMQVREKLNLKVCNTELIYKVMNHV